MRFARGWIVLAVTPLAVFVTVGFRFSIADLVEPLPDLGRPAVPQPELYDALAGLFVWGTEASAPPAYALISQSTFDAAGQVVAWQPTVSPVESAAMPIASTPVPTPQAPEYRPSYAPSYDTDYRVEPPIGSENLKAWGYQPYGSRGQ